MPSFSLALEDELHDTIERLRMLDSWNFTYGPGLPSSGSNCNVFTNAVWMCNDNTVDLRVEAGTIAHFAGAIMPNYSCAEFNGNSTVFNVTMLGQTSSSCQYCSHNTGVYLRVT